MSKDRSDELPECWCGQDKNDGLPRLDILCPKHDELPVAPRVKIENIGDTDIKIESDGMRLIISESKG